MGDDPPHDICTIAPLSRPIQDDPASPHLHCSCLVLVDPSWRTAFPGDFAEFLSRSPTLSGSNCLTRHPPPTDPSPKLMFSFYRRSDKVWGMTPPLDFRTTQATREAQLCTEPHFLAILRNFYQDRPRRRAGSAVRGRQAWRRRMWWTGVWISKVQKTRIHSAETLRFG